MNFIEEWTARDANAEQMARYARLNQMANLRANLGPAAMAIIERGGTSHGASFSWRGHHFDTDAHETAESAHAAIERMARAFGWTPRRWWQFWRWGENRPPWKA